jgi:hypothetical protein
MMEKRQVERWIEGYRDILDSWKMFGVRSGFDVARMERYRSLKRRGRSGGLTLSGEDDEADEEDVDSGYGAKKICPA